MAHVQALFSHWDRIRSPGILGLGAAGTVVLFAGMILTLIVTMLFDFLWGVAVFAPIVGVLFLMSRKDRHERSALTRLVERVDFLSSRRQGMNRYESGPLGRTRWGTNQLPGLAAQSSLQEFQDAYGRSFGVIHHPTPGHAVLVFNADPEGGSLVDDTQVDQWAAGLGSFLASLGDEGGVVAAQIVVECTPDVGTKLRRNVDAARDPNAHALARAIIDELVVIYPSGAATVRGFVTVTFAMTTAYGHKRSIQEVGVDLASRIPRLTGEVVGAGAGSVRPLTGQQLCETIRSEYDPAAAALIERAYADGAVPDLDWSNVGPVSHDVAVDSYRHGDAHSISWQMTGAPTGLVRATVLERFLAPHPDIPRKRVTFLYRPIDAASKNAVAEADTRTTGFLGGSFSGAVSTHNATIRAQNVANGAGLVNFGMVVTATVEQEWQLPIAEAATEGIGASANLLLRVATGMQDTAFASGIPLGLVLPLHLKSSQTQKRRNR